MEKQDLFPIIRHVVYHGVTHEKRMDEGEKLCCLFCGFIFPLNRFSVYMSPDEMQIVTCPKCRKKATILDYFGHTLKETSKLPFPKKTRKPQKTRTYFHKENLL